MTSRLALGLLLTAMVSTTAQAGFISGNYTLSNGNAVALQGLEWMPLTYTAGLSRTNVEDGFTDRFGTTWAAGEWSYATRQQTETLLGSLWDQTYNGWSKGNWDGARWFLSNFGGLGYDQGYGINAIEKTWSDTQWTNVDYAEFFFGEDNACSPDDNVSCSGQVFLADNHRSDLGGRFEDSYYVANSGTLGWFHEYAGIDGKFSKEQWTKPMGYSSSPLGSLLVRNAPATPPATSVSAPTSISVLAIGLLSLLLRRRRSSHQ